MIRLISLNRGLPKNAILLKTPLQMYISKLSNNQKDALINMLGVTPKTLHHYAKPFSSVPMEQKEIIKNTLSDFLDRDFTYNHLFNQIHVV